MTKVTLDTNVYLSALFWKGNPHRVFLQCVKGAVLNSVTPAILSELEGKLRYKFSVPQEKVKEMIEMVTYSSTIVFPSVRVYAVKDDPADDKIIECALEADASFIITGDQHLLQLQKFQNIKIVTPAQFLSSQK